MTPERLSRRQVLVLGAAGAAVLAGCGSGRLTGLEQPDQVPPPEPLDGPSVDRVDDGRLLLFNYQSYIDPGVIKDFEEEFDVSVTVDTFSTVDEFITRLTSVGGAYDVIFPDGDAAFRLNAARMLATLDLDNIPNVRYVPRFFRTLRYDPGGRRTVPYAMYATGIMYRRDVLGEVTSWETLFDPELEGGIGILDDWSETIPMTLIALDLPKYETVPENIDAAADKLIDAKHLFRAFSSLPATNMESGDFLVHHCWTGDTFQARQRVDDPDTIGLVIPDEGTTTGSDTMAIPEGAPHKRTAERFINWMLDPDHARRNAAWTGYSMCHTETEKALLEVPGAIPEAVLTVEDLRDAGNQAHAVPWPADERRIWVAAWARVKNA